MSVIKVKYVMRALVLSFITAAFLAGCGSGDSSPEGEQAGTQSASSSDGAQSGVQSDATEGAQPENQTSDTGSTTEFDGAWMTDCRELRTFGAPEDFPSDGYARTTLTIDSTTKTFSETQPRYLDSQCTTENPNKPDWNRNGVFSFDGVTTTGEGLEATVVRFVTEGGSPDLVGLLYRDGDILYRENNQTTLIDDRVPNLLQLRVPWRLVK